MITPTASTAPVTSAYASPTLTRLGTLSQLTASGSVGNEEGTAPFCDPDPQKTGPCHRV